MTNGDAHNCDSDCHEFELMTIDKIINGKARYITTRNVVVTLFAFVKEFTLTLSCPTSALLMCSLISRLYGLLYRHFSSKLFLPKYFYFKAHVKRSRK